MIYLHIPFCKSRCFYCDFFSSTSSGLKDRYVDALIHEMDARAGEMRRAGANTIYMGGGTPSQLHPSQLQRILHHIQEIVPLEPHAEVTIECNPDDVTPEWVKGLGDTPVNRISMGVQTMDDELLKLLNRRHTAEQARRAVDLLREDGYTNLSLDLMYGLPGQTMEMWRRDVHALLDMHVPHLSAYSLQWEEGTALYRMMQRGEVHEANEELSLDMYRYLVVATRQAGMEHYEISNFSLPGMKARHNSGYWQNEPYVGLGPGAHSYDGAHRRCSNRPDLHSYIAADGYPLFDEEILTDDEWYEEQILKGLRTAQGVSLKALPPRYADYARRMACSHVKAGRLTMINDVLRLTEEGIFVSNDVMSDLML